MTSRMSSLPHMTAKFTLRGHTFEKDKTDVVKAAKGLTPGRIQKYSTVVNGVQFPIRQLVAALTGVPAIEITSQDAYRVLQRLGWEIRIDE